MNQTTSILLPLLQYLASAGAGVAASRLFAQLRCTFPLPIEQPHGWRITAYRVLYAPRYARIAVLVLAGVIGVIAASLVAFLSGANVTNALDTATAGFLAGIASQILHSLSLADEVPHGHA